MSAILASLLSNTALPLISELASSLIYPRVVALAAEGTNLLSSFDATHPLVGEAVAFARDMLGGATPAGEASDVDAALAKIVQAGVSRLAALDPSVTGTTVASSTAPIVAEVAGAVADPEATATALGSAAATAVTSATTSILDKIEGLFKAHATAVTTASAATVPKPSNVG